MKAKLEQLRSTYSKLNNIVIPIRSQPTSMIHIPNSSYDIQA